MSSPQFIIERIIGGEHDEWIAITVTFPECMVAAVHMLGAGGLYCFRVIVKGDELKIPDN